MAEKPRYRALASIDPQELAEFQAGIRKRYTDEQIVAETTAVPLASRAARRSTAPRSSSARSLPGIVVPPPVPSRRESAATPRAAAISRASGGRGRIRRGYATPRTTSLFKTRLHGTTCGLPNLLYTY